MCPTINKSVEVPENQYQQLLDSTWPGACWQRLAMTAKKKKSKKKMEKNVSLILTKIGV